MRQDLHGHLLNTCNTEGSGLARQGSHSAIRRDGEWLSDSLLHAPNTAGCGQETMEAQKRVVYFFSILGPRFGLPIFGCIRCLLWLDNHRTPTAIVISTAHERRNAGIDQKTIPIDNNLLSSDLPRSLLPIDLRHWDDNLPLDRAFLSRG